MNTVASRTVGFLIPLKRAAPAGTIEITPTGGEAVLTYALVIGNGFMVTGATFGGGSRLTPQMSRDRPRVGYRVCRTVV